jgi:hypothetical protein
MIETTDARQEEHFKHVPDLHRLVKKFLRRKANLQVRGDRPCDCCSQTMLLLWILEN